MSLPLSPGRGILTRPVARFMSRSTVPNVRENSMTIPATFLQTVSSGYPRNSTGHLPGDASVWPSQYSRILYPEHTIMEGGPCPTHPEPLGGASSSAVHPSSLSGVSRNFAMFSSTSVFGAGDEGSSLS